MGFTRGSRDQIFELWDPLRITGTVQARNSKFGTQMEPEGNEQNNEKLGQWVRRGSRHPVLEFWDPLCIFGTVQARNSKFCKQVDPEGD